jgi:hypothetical protein
MKENLFFRSNRSKYIRSFVSSAVFTVLSIKLLFISGSFLWLLPAVFFILAGTASLIMILPNQSYLKLDEMGITIRSMFRTINIAWHEVENFYIQRKNMRDVVAFNFTQKNLNYLNFANLVSKNENLPDDYGMKAGELADLLEYYRIRCISLNT